jgi:hypothetical protein
LDARERRVAAVDPDVGLEAAPPARRPARAADGYVTPARLDRARAGRAVLPQRRKEQAAQVKEHNDRILAPEKSPHPRHSEACFRISGKFRCVSVVIDKRRRQVSLAGSVNKMGCIAVVIKRQ